MKIVTWNVNGIRACAKKGLFEFIENEEPDILCLQETKAEQEQVELSVKTLGFRSSVWSSAVKKGYSGVATFSQLEPLQSEKGLGIEKYDREGRIVKSRFPQFDLYNIYFPNGGSGEERHNFKQTFLADLNSYLKSEMNSGREIILVGDYNVAHKEIDVFDPKRLSKESGFLPEERAWFDAFLDLGFVDCYRHFEPQKPEVYSWWSYRELARVRNRGWRIDYICITKKLLPFLKKAEVLNEIEGSDHCPVLVEMNF